MNQRDLSEKLETLAKILEENCNGSDDFAIRSVAEELRKLSNENYAPGNSLSWDAVKPKAVKKQGGFISRQGRNLPF